MAILSKDQMYTPQGVPKLATLIIELCQVRPVRDNDKAVFTLKDEKEGFVSLKRLFVSHVTQDPTEVTFAEVVFGDVGYWLRVRDHKELQGFLAKWREEAEIIRKSKAFQALVNEIENDGKSAFSAAKYLIEEPWKGTAKVKKEQSKETTEKAYSFHSETLKRLEENGMLQ